VKSWLLHPDAPKVTPPEAVQARIRHMASNFDKPVEVGGVN
jgi:oligopeptide transport system ATP-binding protein